MSDGSVLGRVKWGPVAHCPQEAAHQQLVPPDMTQMDFLEVLQCHAQVERFKLYLYKSQGSMQSLKLFYANKPNGENQDQLKYGGSCGCQ